MKKILIYLAAALTPAAAAWAYIPPSSFILKSITSKHANVKGLRIRSVVTVMDGERPGTTRFKAVTYFNPQTDTLHVYAYDERNQKLFAAERRPEAATAADALLFWTNSRSLEIALKARGLPIRTEDELLKLKDEDDRRASEEQRLARWNASVAWVVGGAREGEPQLWIEKDTFLPIRMSASPQPDSDPVDLLFEGQRYYHEFPFPKVVIAVRKKRPLFRDEVTDVSFSTENNEFKGTLIPGFTEAGYSSPGAVRELVAKYFEVLR